MDLYVIPNWERDFENSKSRQIEHATFFCVQNHFDGKRIRRLSRQKNAVELYGAFHIIAAIASRCFYRGVLLDNEGPIGPIELEDKTGFSKSIFENALKKLSDPAVGLMERHEIEQKNGEWTLPDVVRLWAVSSVARRRSASLGVAQRRSVSPGDVEATPNVTEGREAKSKFLRGKADVPRPSASPGVASTSLGVAPRTPASPGVAPTSPGDTERLEQNRTEGNRTEQKGTEQKVPTAVSLERETDVGLDFDEAKDFLHKVFDRKKRTWSYEETKLLSKVVPIAVEDARLIKLWFELPGDHEVFAQKKEGESTRRKQELTTFLRDYNGELDKIHRFAPLFDAATRNGAAAVKKEPPKWREFFAWKYSHESEWQTPEKWDDLARVQKEEYARDFAQFQEATK